MATARAMILRSLRMNGEKVHGDTLGTNEGANHLVDLNSMLESWSTQRLFVYQIIEESFTLVIGSSAYTIGSGGNFNTTRPSKIEDTCLIDYQNRLYEVRNLNEKNFSGQQTVNLSGMPRNFYYDISVPLGTIYFDYKPDVAYDFRLKSWKQLQTFATLDTDVTFPVGYRRAIESNYAIESAPGLTSVSQETLKIAKDSKAAIQTLNAPEGVLRLPLGISGRRIFDIRTG